MHGLEVTPRWCELGESAAAGSTSIVVDTETNWQVIYQHYVHRLFKTYPCVTPASV